MYAGGRTFLVWIGSRRAPVIALRVVVQFELERGGYIRISKPQYFTLSPFTHVKPGVTAAQQLKRLNVDKYKMSCYN